MRFPPFIVGSCYVYYIELSICTPLSRNEKKNECSRVYLIQSTYSMGFVYLVGQFVYLVGQFVYLVGQFVYLVGQFLYLVGQFV